MVEEIAVLAGGMIPLSPVDTAVAFEPLIVIVVAPEDTIVSRMGVTVGVIIPSVPVEM